MRKKIICISSFVLLIVGCTVIGLGFDNTIITTYIQQWKVCENVNLYRDNLQELDEDEVVQNVNRHMQSNKKADMKQEDDSDMKDYTGAVDCILEIPSIDLVNLVLIGGNQEENLSKHYLVTAQKHMSYGEGNYIICGHHSFLTGVALNRLNEVKIGDFIYVTQNNRKDVFVVEEIVDSQWGMANEDFGDDANRLAIYTCREQKARPKPYFVVRATKLTVKKKREKSG